MRVSFRQVPGPGERKPENRGTVKSPVFDGLELQAREIFAIL